MKAKKIVKLAAACVVALCSGVGLGVIGSHMSCWIIEDLANWVNS